MHTLTLLRRCSFFVTLFALLAHAGYAGAEENCNNKCQDEKIAALKAQVDALTNALTGLEGRVFANETTIAEQQTTLGCMSISEDGEDLFFTGCNVHVRNGLGATGPDLNGLGNLIVGYNEDASALGQFPASERSGSHNLVVGAGHSYTNRGGLVAGLLNRVSAGYATVTGGIFNTASGERSSVSGGQNNIASGERSSVSGGNGNVASAIFSSVSGGLNNNASGTYSSVSGGLNNNASGVQSSVSGGSANVASGHASSVSGGQTNNASAGLTSVSGGLNRGALNDFNWAAGTLLEVN